MSNGFMKRVLIVVALKYNQIVMYRGPHPNGMVGGFWYPLSADIGPIILNEDEAMRIMLSLNPAFRLNHKNRYKEYIITTVTNDEFGVAKVMLA